MNKFEEFVNFLVTLIFLVVIASLGWFFVTTVVNEIHSEKDSNKVEISDKTEHESKNTIEINGETYVLVEDKKESEETIEINGKTYTLIEEADKKEKEIIEVDGKTYILTEDSYNETED